MKKDPTRNTRAANYRAATKETGGAQINVRISADAAAELTSLRSTGLTVREAVERALALSAEARMRWRG